jgi:hypothetical protein
LPFHHPKDGAPMGLGFTREIADPSSLGGRELTYAADKIMDPDQLVGAAHYHHAWPGQLPMMICRAEDGIGQNVTFDIPEDAAGRAPSIEAELVLEVTNFWHHDDRLELFWNGKPLDADIELRRTAGEEEHRLTCRIPCGSIRAGLNRLELRLVDRDPRLDPFISLWKAELTIPEDGA